MTIKELRELLKNYPDTEQIKIKIDDVEDGWDIFFILLQTL